jgi:hypothetical protein
MTQRKKSLMKEQDQDHHLDDYHLDDHHLDDYHLVHHLSESH